MSIGVNVRNRATWDRGQTGTLVRKDVRRKQQVKSRHEPEEGLHTKTD